MNELNLINNLPLDSDLKSIKIGDEVAPIELSKDTVRVKELDIISTSGSFVLDEDNMVSDSATQVATQQSIKAYVDYTQYIRQLMIAGWNASNASKDYLPLTGYIIEKDSPSSSNEYIAFVAPYDGLLEKVVVRAEAVCGSSIVGFHKSDEGTEVPDTTATEAITVDMAVDDTGYTFDFTGTASFDKGDIITISFDPANTPYDTVATIVWKFDTTT